MSKIYIFDVDGTLTRPRQAMDERFAEFFFDFCRANMVYLVSGSNYEKLREQVPQHILNGCRGVFACSGATLHVMDRKIFSREHKFDEKLVTFCQEAISKSPYIFRTGNHIEYRTGMLNVSTIGRNANIVQRNSYYAWDKVSEERKSIVEALNANFPMYEASAGGEISIDIVPKGWNKSVVKQHVLNENPAGLIRFFGDRMNQGGNDRPLAKALCDKTNLHKSHPVSDYKKTWYMLERGIESEIFTLAA